jgi:hypothetical protein
MLKDIDGKVIHSSDQQQIENLPKEVEFRKSISQQAPLEMLLDRSPSRASNHSGLG